TELVAGGTGTAPAPALFTTTVADVRRDPAILREEMFGPASIVVEYDDDAELIAVAELIEGQLTATVQGEDGDDVGELLARLEARTGRVLWNGWPTGVSVTYAQQHGGPYPATTSSTTTSVGTAAVRRFLRPVAYQNLPDSLLPPALQEDNPWGITRRVDGRWVPGRAGAQCPPTTSSPRSSRPTTTGPSSSGVCGTARPAGLARPSSAGRRSTTSSPSLRPSPTCSNVRTSARSSPVSPAHRGGGSTRSSAPRWSDAPTAATSSPRSTCRSSRRAG